MKHLKQNYFLLAFFLYVLVGIILILFSQKGDYVLLLNNSHSHWADQFFKYGTHLGDGSLFFVLILGFLIWKRSSTWEVILVALVVLLTSYGLKQTIFNDWPRPTAYFSEDISWNYVEGVTVRTISTFPSGHTMAAFAIYFLLSMQVKQKWAQLLLFLPALIVAVSRVYLLQHFLIDVYFGAIIGVIAVYTGIALRKLLRKRKMAV